jgi:hypothetical protein
MGVVDLSSPFAEQTGPVALRVTAGNPFIEVFVVDHAFALVARSIGELQARVTPGVYTVKVRLGDAMAERLVVVDEDMSVDMSSELTVVSAAPIGGTSRTHEYQMDTARTESEEVALTAGTGSAVFLMSRSWSAPEVAGGTTAEMSLRRPDGTIVAALHSVSMEIGPHPARGATIQVDPGPYVLRWYDYDTGVVVEQAVYAVADWQTQVFLLREPDAERGANYSVSMLMTMSGFYPEDSMARTVEVARSALAGERKVASTTISELLLGKFNNPMLGLFGAHLMLLAREAELNTAAEERRGLSKKRLHAPVEFSQEQFDEVVHNLAGLLGPDHPDVVALTTRTSDHQLPALAPVTMPPLLWRSWLLLLDASHDHPPLVPADTWRRACRPLPLRPFLIWAVGGEDYKDVEDQWRAEVSQVLHRGPPQGPATPHRRSLPADMELGSPSADDQRRQLSRQLLAPRSAIDELAAY